MLWRKFIRVSRIAVVVVICIVTSPVTARNVHEWPQWSPMGKADFSFVFWRIYTSTLLSKTGNIDVKVSYSRQSVALIIEYHRDISASQLLEATSDQWLALKFDSGQIAIWLKALSRIYPEIVEGDSLAFVVENDVGQFYFRPRNETQWRKLGLDVERGFVDAFISIWLSEKTEYPRQRQQLLGKEK